MFGHRSCYDLILVIRRRDTIPGIMCPHVLIVRQKPILEERKQEKLEKVRGAKPSAYLEPNGALGFVPGSFSSRTRADVVATRSLPSVVAVVDSLIAVEGGNRDDRSGVFRDSVLLPPHLTMFGEPLLDISAEACALGTLVSPIGEVRWSLK